ncbi:MAG: hypothetical protein K6A92_07445 [Lachnospiraceae bacterium]|nr:hypothetical protein [Lachnospiraceae bacterium]
MSKTGKTGPDTVSARKAEENRTSAFSLLLVGGVGLILNILSAFGVLPIRIGNTSNYIITAVIMALFIFLGGYCYRASRRYEAKAAKESHLLEEIRMWCDASLSAGQIDADLSPEEGDSEGELFYMRRDRMEELILARFPEANVELLEPFIESYYETLYPDEE